MANADFSRQQNRPTGGFDASSYRAAAPAEEEVRLTPFQQKLAGLEKALPAALGKQAVAAALSIVVMLACFFAGAMVGGAISGLPFGMEGFHVGNLVFCMISKVLLMAVFASIYVLMGVIGKQRLWLTILLSLGVGMFLFNIIPMVTPLTATMMNVHHCLAGGVLLGDGLGFGSKAVLDRFDIL